MLFGFIPKSAVTNATGMDRLNYIFRDRPVFFVNNFVNKVQ